MPEICFFIYFQQSRCNIRIYEIFLIVASSLQKLQKYFSFMKLFNCFFGQLNFWNKKNSTFFWVIQIFPFICNSLHFPWNHPESIWSSNKIRSNSKSQYLFQNWKMWSKFKIQKSNQILCCLKLSRYQQRVKMFVSSGKKWVFVNIFCVIIFWTPKIQL